MVRTRRFHCCGPGSIPGQGTKTPKALVWPKQNKQKTRVEGGSGVCWRSRQEEGASSVTERAVPGPRGGPWEEEEARPQRGQCAASTGPAALIRSAKIPSPRGERSGPRGRCRQGRETPH